ncbi:MAG: hypothetical protein ACXAC8_04595 [Candidatus Hodarchaeales archaeon]
MNRRSRKPLIVPLLMVIIVASFAVTLFLSSQQVQIELPSAPEIEPKITKNGSSFKGFIDVIIPLNITNNSPASLQDIQIYASLSVISIESFGLFPDTTILNISEFIKLILPNESVHLVLELNVSSWVPILAIVDAYLILDVDIQLNYVIGTFMFPIHLVTRLQDLWEASFNF